MERGSDSVSPVVGREKHGASASLHASGSWAVPGPLFLSYLMQREAEPTACSWSPGEKQHPSLSRVLPWERTRRGGGFSWCSVRCRSTTSTRTSDGVVASHGK